MKRLCLVLALVAGTVGAGEGDLKWVDALAARAASEVPRGSALDADLKAAKLQLKSAKAAKVGGRNMATPMTSPAVWHRFIQFASKEEKARSIKECEQLVAGREEELKKDGTRLLPELDTSLRVGSAGTVWRGELRVVQVIDQKNAIVSMVRAQASASSVGGVPQKRYSAVPHELWLAADVSQFADGTTVKFESPVLITGTKQYQTVSGGTKTLFVARPWNTAELERFKTWTAK